MLQVPRQPVGAERTDGRGALEDLHHSGRTETGPQEFAGCSIVGPSGAGVWSSPAVDLKAKYGVHHDRRCELDPAGDTSDAFMAFDLKTGKLLWTRQTTAGDAFTVACGLPEALRVNCPEAKGPDHDFGSSPILVDLPNGRRALIAGQKSGVVHAVDPDSGGEILWQTRVGKGSVAWRRAMGFGVRRAACVCRAFGRDS